MTTVFFAVLFIALGFACFVVALVILRGILAWEDRGRRRRRRRGGMLG